jgi:sugar (pentulose or hexulose) kinase
MRSFILAIDAGSSSIRCTAYDYHSGGGGVVFSNRNLASGTPPLTPLVEAVNGVSYAIPLEAVVPNTGHIRIHEVLIAIDSCIDETLSLLRQSMMSDDSSHTYQVVAIGFSTFVMNFVAVDINGDPVGDVATCSYACNRDDVVKECQCLRE